MQTKKKKSPKKDFFKKNLLCHPDWPFNKHFPETAFEVEGMCLPIASCPPYNRVRSSCLESCTARVSCEKRRQVCCKSLPTKNLGRAKRNSSLEQSESREGPQIS